MTKPEPNLMSAGSPCTTVLGNILRSAVKMEKIKLAGYKVVPNFRFHSSLHRYPDCSPFP